MEPKTELQKIAAANAIKKEQETYHRTLTIQRMNNRIENDKMSRCLALINKEAEMEKDFKEKKDHAAIINAETEKEISLAHEISQQAREETCQHLRRQHLRETDPDLRELTRKLKEAYIRKDLQQQILNNEYRRLQDKIEAANANKIVQDALYDDSKAKEREKNVFEKKLQYCTELRTQIDSKEKMKRDTQKTEMDIQRKQIDDIVKSIDEDHKRTIQTKRSSVARVRAEMAACEEAARARRRREHAARADERARLAREQAAVDERTSAVLQGRLDRQRAREETNKRIGDQIAAEHAAREEREELIRQLQHQEYLESGEQQQLAERASRAVDCARVRAALDAQVAARAHAAQHASHSPIMDPRIAAEEEKEKEDARLKRERARQYALELRRQMADDARRRRAERDAEEGRGAAVTEQQARRDAEASAEKEIILKQHGRVLNKD